MTESINTMYWVIDERCALMPPFEQTMIYYSSDKQEALIKAHDHTQNTGEPCTLYKVRMLQEHSLRKPPVVELAGSRVETRRYRKRRKWEKQGRTDS